MTRFLNLIGTHVTPNKLLPGFTGSPKLIRCMVMLARGAKIKLKFGLRGKMNQQLKLSLCCLITRKNKTFAIQIITQFLLFYFGRLAGWLAG